MKPEIAKKLEAILDNHQQKKRATEERLSEQQTAEAKNIADFEATKRDVIMPAFKEIVDLYKGRGIHILIVEENEKANSTGGLKNPNIRLDMKEVYPSAGLPKPEFTLSFAKGNRDISLYTSTGSQAGPAGHVALDDLTADWIQSAFVKYQSPSY